MSFKELIDKFLIKQSEENFCCPICKESVKYLKIHKRKNHSVWISTVHSIKNHKIVNSVNDILYYENFKEGYFFAFYKDKFIVNFKSNEFPFIYDDFEDLDTNKIFNKIKENLLFM